MHFYDMWIVFIRAWHWIFAWNSDYIAPQIYCDLEICSSLRMQYVHCTYILHNVQLHNCTVEYFLILWNVIIYDECDSLELCNIDTWNQFRFDLFCLCQCMPKCTKIEAAMKSISALFQYFQLGKRKIKITSNRVSFWSFHQTYEKRMGIKTKEITYLLIRTHNMAHCTFCKSSVDVFVVVWFENSLNIQIRTDIVDYHANQ